MEFNMIKYLKAILPVILIIALILSACGGGGGGTGDDNANDGQNAESSAPATSAGTTTQSAAAVKDEVELLKELEEIYISFGSTPGNFQDGPIAPGAYSVFDEIAKKTGVRFDIFNIDRDKFRMMAAAQDLPNVYQVYDASMIQSLISGGIMLGLNDLIEEYGPNVKDGYNVAIDYQTLTLGDMYLFPYNVYDEPSDKHIPLRNGVTGYYVRYDLYKEIGSPEIKDSWHGFFDVLEELQAHAREKYNDESIYCFSSFVDWGLWPYLCVYPFTQGYGDIYDVNQLVHAVTGELEDALLDVNGGFWEGIAFYNEAYNRGLFDPEGLTQKNPQYMDKLNNGQVIVSMLAWYDLNDDLKDEGACMVLLPNSCGVMMMLTPDLLPMGNRFSDAVAVNAKFKTPERFIQFMDWANSTEGKRTLANGVQGETWDYVNDIPQFIGVFKDEYLYSENWRKYFDDYPGGIHGTPNIGMRAFTSNMPNGFADDGYPYNLMNQPEFIALTATEQERAFAADFGCTYPGEVYMKWVKEGKMQFSDVYLTMPAQLFGTVDEEISIVVNRSMQHFEANMGKVIMAPTQDDFKKEQAKIIDDLMNMGMGDASASIAKQFEEAKALVSQFTK